MAPKYKAVFLDVDGVLLDSLPQHLAICVDKAREFGLDLTVPDAAGFRRLVASGVSVSPMVNFFRAVGFPTPFAERATADYEREFMQRYPPSPFDGIEEMLTRLADAGCTLGLVTANTSANVEPALGEVMRLFDRRGLFYFDAASPRSKANGLREGARRLEIPLTHTLFVGDQPSDANAARDAGCDFLAVTYGWGFAQGDGTEWTVDSVGAIADALSTG
jgi:phosphoglycolate phosphatase